ncbi:Cas1p-domain-containing protein [Xylariaceae sp. FL0804]|nr:Cas1p-domain-containing protein [Xylariaceae sp. FL0804]
MTQLRRFAASWHPLSSVTYSTLVVVLLWIAYQRIFISQDDPNRCRSLLNDGSWSPAYHHHALAWEPTGCRMIEYASDAFHDCLRGRTLVFAGDSTVRQIYWAAARKLDSVRAEVELNNGPETTTDDQRDLTFQAEGVTLQFIFDPWLNATATRDALSTFQELPTSSSYVEDLRKKGEESAALVLLGAPGLWAARYGGDDYMSVFERSIDGISPYLTSASHEKTSTALPGMGGTYESLPANQILLTPARVPKQHVGAQTGVSERVDEMNKFLSHLPPNQSSHIAWAFDQMTHDTERVFGDDSLLAENTIADHEVDVILNSHCNTLAAQQGQLPKGTCCVTQPRNGVYNLALVFLCVVMLYVPRYHSVPSFVRRLGIVPELVTATRDILVALVWCWICDGTLQFSKAERHYQQGPFIAICLFWLVGSLAALHKTIRPPSQFLWTTAQDVKQTLTEHGDRGFLNRDQTDEMKGLMQGLILLYHYNYAEQSLWVYKIVRVLISGYFFLSAYGHTIYVLRYGDYSFRRVAVVLFRTNALSALLPYMMGTGYSNYYFAPTITFYYLVVYMMLLVFKRSNADPWGVATKVLATTSFTSVFITTPGYLEAVTNGLQSIFRMSLDAQELRASLRLDRYIVFIGVMVAVLVNTATVQDASEIFSAKTTSRSGDNGRTKFYVIATVGLCGFAYWSQTHLPTKQDYNAAHPYITWIPILATITLRNVHPSARKIYLALPAALGKFSLETYVLQYHIWLGGDATAKLTLGFTSWYGSLVEKAVITTLFVGMAALTHRATRTFANTLSVPGFLLFLAAMWVGNIVYG